MFPTNNEIQDYFLREQVRFVAYQYLLRISTSSQVMQRHGNRCTVTGVYDWCRAQRHQVPKASLDYACILPRTARLDGCREELSQSIVRSLSFTDSKLTYSLRSTSISLLKAGTSYKIMRR